MVFQEITLTWGGREFKIAPDRVMRCIAQIEDVLTLTELAAFAERNDVPLAKVARAFGVVLRYAGAKVSDDEVYAGMFASGDRQRLALEAVQTLLAMMVPPPSFQGAAEPKKAAPASARSSSKPRSRRR